MLQEWATHCWSNHTLSTCELFLLSARHIGIISEISGRCRYLHSKPLSVDYDISPIISCIPGFILTYTWFYITKIPACNCKCKGKDQPRMCLFPAFANMADFSIKLKAFHIVFLNSFVSQHSLVFPPDLRLFLNGSAAPCSVLVSPAVCCHRNGHQQETEAVLDVASRNQGLWVRETLNMLVS